MVRTYHLNDPDFVHWWQTAYARGILDEATCFQSHQWISQWWKWIGSRDTRREPFVLAVTTASGIRAVAPLFIQHRPNSFCQLLSTAHWMGDDLSPYSGLIREKGFDLASLWDELLDYIRTETRIASLSLRDTLPVHLPNHLAFGTSTPGSTTFRILRDSAMEPIQLGQVTPRLRRSLRATLTRFTEEGWHWESRQGIHAEARDFLERQSKINFGENSFFCDPANCAFLDAVLTEFPSIAHWSVLKAPDSILHVFLSLAHHATLAYFLAAGVRTKETSSPGLLNIHLTLAAMPNLGFHVFDFLRGEEDYKMSFLPNSFATTNVEIPLRGSRRLALLATMRRWRKGRA